MIAACARHPGRGSPGGNCPNSGGSFPGGRRRVMVGVGRGSVQEAAAVLGGGDPRSWRRRCGGARSRCRPRRRSPGCRRPIGPPPSRAAAGRLRRKAGEARDGRRRARAAGRRRPTGVRPPRPGRRPPMPSPPGGEPPRRGRDLAGRGYPLRGRRLSPTPPPSTSRSSRTGRHADRRAPHRRSAPSGEGWWSLAFGCLFDVAGARRHRHGLLGRRACRRRPGPGLRAHADGSGVRVLGRTATYCRARLPWSIPAARRTVAAPWRRRRRGPAGTKAGGEAAGGGVERCRGRAIQDGDGSRAVAAVTPRR